MGDANFSTWLYVGTGLKTQAMLSSKCLPRRNLRTHISLTFSGGPWTWPITVPCLVFFTQPVTPSFLAWSSVYCTVTWALRHSQMEHTFTKWIICYNSLMNRDYSNLLSVNLHHSAVEFLILNSDWSESVDSVSITKALQSQLQGLY